MQNIFYLNKTFKQYYSVAKIFNVRNQKNLLKNNINKIFILIWLEKSKDSICNLLTSYTSEFYYLHVCVREDTCGLRLSVLNTVFSWNGATILQLDF